MAADIMAHQVRLRNSWLLLATLLLACNARAPKLSADAALRRLNKAGQNMAWQNGLLVVDNSPFSGTLYTLWPHATDTAEVERYLGGKEHGEWKKFYRKNQIKEHRHFENGQKVGQYLAWWENGKPQWQYFFLNGEYHGTCKEWNALGTLSKLMNYRHGYEEGPQQWWYDNGKIKANYIIKSGRRYGLLGTKNCMNVSDSIFKN